MALERFLGFRTERSSPPVSSHSWSHSAESYGSCFALPNVPVCPCRETPWRRFPTCAFTVPGRGCGLARLPPIKNSVCGIVVLKSFRTRPIQHLSSCEPCREQWGTAESYGFGPRWTETWLATFAGRRGTAFLSQGKKSEKRYLVGFHSIVVCMRVFDRLCRLLRFKGIVRPTTLARRTSPAGIRNR